jgi:hypothetical protein
MRLIKLKIIKEPHQLFRGANGIVTAGITVRDLDAPDGAELNRMYPYMVEWDINTFSLTNDSKKYAELLGMTEEDYSKVLVKCKEIERCPHCGQLRNN